MTFFYNLNDKLNAIREKPEVTHGQLNERDMSRAAKGYEKYGKEGMQALAKAGREGKALDPVRNRYDKYDEGMDEAIRIMAKPEGSKVTRGTAAYVPKNSIAGKTPQGQAHRDATAAMAKSARAAGGKLAMNKTTDATGKRVPGGYDAMAKGVTPYRSSTEEGMGDVVKKVGSAVKKVGGAVLNKLGHGSDEDMRKDLQRKMGMPQTGKKPEQVKEKMSPAKAQSFAALAPPKDKITFADKIAGAKKEVDEMLGDVAAEAMKSALSGGQKKLDKNNNGRLDANDFAMLRKGGKKEVADEGFPTVDSARDEMRKRKVGDVTHGDKHDTQEIPGGRRVTRRVDPNTGHSVGADDDASADGEKRGRGRPKGTKAAIGAKGPSGKSKLMTKEGDNESDDIKQAMAMLKKAGYTVTKAAGHAEELDEKAVSKKQQRFMGMVHATQKGEKAPSKEVGKVAKSMGKKDAEDFASTKHKGLPEKKKPEGKSDAPKKKKEKTEEAGGTGTPTASSGFGFGKGIYDSLDRDVEAMIAEGMNINMSMNTDANGGPSKSLTVTATDEDALKLSELLKNAGLGNGGNEGYGGSGYQSACGCGTPDCSCGDEEMDEAYGDTQPTLNEPNWPTNQETAQDNLEYSGGLNKPKSTGQTTVPVIASQEERQESYAEAEEDAIKRMMEMAGVKEAKKPDANKDGIPDYAQDGKGSKDLGKAKDKEKKVDESILASTANLWKEYKGQYGV